MVESLSLAFALLALGGLVWWYTRVRAEDRLSAILTTGRALSTISSRAQLIDGANHIPVALTLDPRRITYRSPTLDASIDVHDIDEVEYGSDMMTGGIADGAVLRLRSHGRAFEFVLDMAAAERWSHQLPPHRLHEERPVEVLATPGA
jgi:hypothetical protein